MSPAANKMDRPAAVDTPTSAEELTQRAIELSPWLRSRRGAILHAFRSRLAEDLRDPYPGPIPHGQISSRVAGLFWLLCCSEPWDAKYWGTTRFRVSEREIRRGYLHGQVRWFWTVHTVRNGRAWSSWRGDAESRPAARRQLQIAIRELRRMSKGAKPGGYLT